MGNWPLIARIIPIQRIIVIQSSFKSFVNYATIDYVSKRIYDEERKAYLYKQWNYIQVRIFKEAFFYLYMLIHIIISYLQL